MKVNIWSGVIDLEIFHSEVIFIITNSKDYLNQEIVKVLSEDLGMKDKYANEFSAEIRKSLDEDEVLPPEQLLDVPCSTGGRDFFLIFRGTPKSLDTGVIIHELHHAVTAVCKERGIKDEEAESYMQEYLYRCLKHQLANFYKSKKS